MQGFPSETTHSHQYELMVHRRNPAGRALSSLSVLKTNDRSEIEAEHARRDANWGDASSSLRKRNRLEIVEHKLYKGGPGASRRGAPPEQ